MHPCIFNKLSILIENIVSAHINSLHVDRYQQSDIAYAHIISRQETFPLSLTSPETSLNSTRGQIQLKCINCRTIVELYHIWLKQISVFGKAPVLELCTLVVSVRAPGSQHLSKVCLTLSPSPSYCIFKSTCFFF